MFRKGLRIRCVLPNIIAGEKAKRNLKHRERQLHRHKKYLCRVVFLLQRSEGQR